MVAGFSGGASIVLLIFWKSSRENFVVVLLPKQGQSYLDRICCFTHLVSSALISTRFSGLQDFLVFSDQIHRYVSVSYFRIVASIGTY